ncbi:MAG: MFS transporter [Gemmatimonadetes bacterium]|nr:MAG: MFS transporter [Gemmatimonadota bacterium]
MSASRNAGTRTVAAWCFYDWANSAFTTMVVTFVYATYFTKTFAANEDLGTELWSKGIVVSAILIALLSPVLGTMADRGGARLRALILATLVCVMATVALTFVAPGGNNAVVLALGIFVVANVAFEVGMVFYNAFLPAIVPRERIGRVSGYGWGLGYIGGLMALVVGLVGFVGLGDMSPILPLPTELGFNIRATNLLVAGWFLVFSIPAFIYLKDAPATGKGQGLDLRGTFTEVANTFRQIRQYREVVKFLLARLIYNDGLVTVFAFGAIYAAGTFGMSIGEVMIFGIVLNLAAGAGAFLFGFIDDKVGGKTTIMVSLVALSIATVIAVLAPTRAWFWVAGIGIGMFVGPNQSASRSLMGRFVPERHQAEFFGFFAFSGKATAFMGPLLFGELSGAFGQRVGMGSVLLFFVIGGVMLLTVSEKAGIEAAQRGSGAAGL